MAGLLTLVLIAYAVSPVHATERQADAETFIRDLASSGLAMLQAKDATDAERELEFRRLVRLGFALDTIGQFVAGRHWRKMRNAQQAEFQDLFAEWLMSSYGRRLGGYGGQTLETLGSIALNNSAGDVVVRTRILHPDGRPPFAADWRVRAIAGELKIIDVIVEGVSMAAAQRAEFDSVVRKVGVEGLLANLRSRVAVLVAGTD